MKKIEVSAYGVEDVKTQEIETINGGAWWGIIGAVASVVSALVAIYETGTDSGGGRSVVGSGTGPTVYGADSVRMNDGTMLYGVDSMRM